MNLKKAEGTCASVTSFRDDGICVRILQAIQKNKLRHPFMVLRASLTLVAILCMMKGALAQSSTASESPGARAKGRTSKEDVAVGLGLPNLLIRNYL